MKRIALVPLVFILMLSIAPVSAQEYTVAYTGTAGPDSSQGDYTDTWDDEMTSYEGINEAVGVSYVILNFTTPEGDLVSFNYSVNGAAYFGDDGNAELWVYNWTGHSWVYLADLGIGFGAWANGTVSGSDYSDGTQISMRATSVDSGSSSGVAVIIAWLEDIEIDHWHEVADITLTFLAPLHMWGIESTIIIIGLIMIPASGIYLVKGGRKGLSDERFWCTLIIFFVGFALLIGGIMP